MYKYSKDGVSVLTVLDKRKQKMNGLFPIKVQVIHNRKQKYYSTGQEVSIRDWEVLPHTKNRHLSEVRRNIENSFSLIRQQVEFLSFQGEFHFDILNARLGRYSDFSVKVELYLGIKKRISLFIQNMLNSLPCIGGISLIQLLFSLPRNEVVYLYLNL